LPAPGGWPGERASRPLKIEQSRAVSAGQRKQRPFDSAEFPLREHSFEPSGLEVVRLFALR